MTIGIIIGFIIYTELLWFISKSSGYNEGFEDGYSESESKGKI